MRKNLYPPIAGVLVCLWLLAEMFEDAINNASWFVQVGLSVLVGLVAVGAVLLALWDTKVI